MKIVSWIKRSVAWLAFTIASVNIIGHGVAWGENLGHWYLPPVSALVAFTIIALMMFLWSVWKDS